MTSTMIQIMSFDAAQYKSCAGAAKALHAKLYELAELEGQKSEKEVCIYNPVQNELRGYPRRWSVSWEAGPYEWAVYLSLEGAMRGPWGYGQPHYSFDMFFVDGGQ